MDKTHAPRFVEFGWQLNDLVMDLKTPTDVIRMLKSERNPKLVTMSLNRMALCVLIVNLCKLREVITHYGLEIKSLPQDIRNDLQTIRQEIESKGLYQYRSTYIAHAFTKAKGKSKKQALPIKDAREALAKIIGESLNPPEENAYSFYRWVYEQENEKCVVSVIARTVKELESLAISFGVRV